MPNEPQIVSLSYKKRSLFFWVLVLVFLVSLPSLIFYTTGYRLSFEEEATTILTTGGVYVTTDNLEVEVYIDDTKVEKPRLFRSAYYIQDVAAGVHRIVVQQPGLHTWVKDLPVDPYIVIETSAFNMPIIPHLRPITQYKTATGTAVYFEKDKINKILAEATTTESYLISSTKATTTYKTNEEFVYVASLFASSTVNTSVFSTEAVKSKPFKFSTTTEEFELASTTLILKESGGLSLIKHDGEIYAFWLNSGKSMPYYFCIPEGYASSTALRYGEHVADQFLKLSISTTTPLIFDNNRICRPEIRIDRKGQDVFFYDFLPNSSDLVLLQLQDGLYVTEIDDRAWQNTQKIYSGNDFKVIVVNGLIFIMVDGLYFELVTEIEQN